MEVTDCRGLQQGLFLLLLVRLFFDAVEVGEEVGDRTMISGGGRNVLFVVVAAAGS